VEGGLRAVAPLCRITALDLSPLRKRIKDEGAGRLAAALEQCTSLAHLNLSNNFIGAEGAGRLAAVLGQCPSLAHLNFSVNGIGAEGVWGMALAFASGRYVL
jgi:Ran GTPase-activating protein (RanGAP) involved in mRNA processing and transport